MRVRVCGGGERNRIDLAQTMSLHRQNTFNCPGRKPFHVVGTVCASPHLLLHFILSNRMKSHSLKHTCGIMALFVWCGPPFAYTHLPAIHPLCANSSVCVINRETAAPCLHVLLCLIISHPVSRYSRIGCYCLDCNWSLGYRKVVRRWWLVL